MELTRALIERRHPHPVPLEVDRSGDVPEAQLRRELKAMLARAPGRERGLGVFAYGSLIWRPEVEPAAQSIGTVYGYHRRFCLHQVRSRGTPDNPCLMMALDQGGACRSVLQWFTATDLEDKIWPIWFREMRGHGYRAKFVKVHDRSGIRPALTFVANRAGPRYVGRLPVAEVANYLACGCGPRGACAEYLLHTMTALREHGIHDHGLKVLERTVAARLEAS